MAQRHTQTHTHLTGRQDILSGGLADWTDTLRQIEEKTETDTNSKTRHERERGKGSKDARKSPAPGSTVCSIAEENMDSRTGGELRKEVLYKMVISYASP